jgi:hypothetical protein
MRRLPREFAAARGAVMSARPKYRLWHELRGPDAPQIFAVPGAGHSDHEYTSARLRHLNRLQRVAARAPPLTGAGADRLPAGRRHAQARRVPGVGRYGWKKSLAGAPARVSTSAGTAMPSICSRMMSA